MTSHPPTVEQSAIRDAYLPGDDLVVEAGAGTGKTTTLRLLAEADRRRGVYIAYNKVTANDAARRFPPTMTCSTAHALAYRAVGKKYRARLNGPRLRAQDTAAILGRLDADAFGDGVIAGLSRLGLARLTLSTVDAFCKSADDELSAQHVPFVAGLNKHTLPAAVEATVALARAAWLELGQPVGDLEFSHNTYLKMWALSRPRLHVDVVVVDEAQDLNPCVAQVVDAQQHAQRVAVGDRSQAINGWNGAIDAMSGWSWRRLTLTQSFRFGPAAAEVANQWLDVLDAPLRLTGLPNIDTRVGYVAEPDAILCRSNIATLNAAARKLDAGRKVAMVGGTREVKALAFAARDLQAGKATDHPQFIGFKTWDDVREYADSDSGADLRTFVKMIDQSGPARVLAIADQLVDEPDAEVVTSTVHKAKGREWPRVLIGSDFPQPGDVKPDGSEVKFTRDDAMLAYVAVTRGREQLDPGGLAWIEHQRPDLAPAKAAA